MFQTMLHSLRVSAPMVHCITNYVTANDCANLLLACGASPIMADDPEEAAQITARCQGLCLNLGTLHRHTVPAMLEAGRTANRLGLPVVLDPVGAGASRLRTQTALRLLEEVRFTVIRGNLSELKALAGAEGGSHGVDAADADRITEATLEEAVAFAKAFARKTGAVTAITGAIDLVTDGEQAFCIRNGHPLMRSVTGTGCMLSALTAAFAAANPGQPLEAAAAATAAMGLCGETAQRRLTAPDGSAAYRNYLLDAVYNLTPEALQRGANYEVR